MEEKAASPQTSPIEIQDCIEELLKYILHSYCNGDLQIDLPFSSTFCSDLLSTTTATETSCECPLYKHLAAALCESINGGSDIKNKELWNELMLENWLQLLNILKSVDFALHVQEPFFTQLRDGTKTVEGRCAVGAYNRIGSGSLILFNKCLLLEVQEVHRYASFFEMLEAETLEKVLPGVKTIEEGIQVYRKFYSEEKEMCNGVLGIHVMKPSLQLHFPLARILSEMSCEGIQRLLGQGVPIEQFTKPITPSMT